MTPRPRRCCLRIAVAGAVALTVGPMPASAARAAAGEAPPVLQLISRVERVEVLAGLTIVLPLRLLNSSDADLRAVEPSPYLNSLALRLADAEGQEVPRSPIRYGPLFLSIVPEVIALAPGAGADVDVWLGAFGRSSLPRGEYTATVTYHCTEYEGWGISPLIGDRAFETTPIPITVSAPVTELDRAALAMLVSRPRPEPAPLDELIDRFEAYMQAVIERCPVGPYALEACFRAARLLNNEGRAARALAWIDRARQLDPDYDPAEELTWMQIECLRALGRHAEAEPLLQGVRSRRAYAGWLLAQTAAPPPD